MIGKKVKIERTSCLGVEVPEAGEPGYEALLVLTLAVLADVPAYLQIQHTIIYSSRILCLSSCLSSCRSCGTQSYSLCFSNLTDQGDETEGLEREGLEMGDRRWRD